MNKKTIWITGASSGIGEASARKFAKEGWKVIISARRVELLEKLSTDENIFSYPLDVIDSVKAKEVFKKISEKENGGLTSVAHKASKDELEEYFFSILSDYDEDRVYASDIKKIIQWYNLLHKNELLNLIEEEASEKEDNSKS
mgnify:CR=1 FL=1